MDTSYLFCKDAKIINPKVEFNFNMTTTIPKMEPTNQELPFQKSNIHINYSHRREKNFSSERLSLPPKVSQKKEECYTDMSFLEMMTEDTKNILEKRERMKDGRNVTTAYL